MNFNRREVNEENKYFEEEEEEEKMYLNSVNFKKKFNSIEKKRKQKKSIKIIL